MVLFNAHSAGNKNLLLQYVRKTASICPFYLRFLHSMHIFTSVYREDKEHNMLISLQRIDLNSPQLSNATSVSTNYTPSILPHLFVTSFSFKYRFHDYRESERAPPLGAAVSTGTKPQITYFLQPPTPDTHRYTHTCSIK